MQPMLEVHVKTSEATSTRQLTITRWHLIRIGIDLSHLTETKGEDSIKEI